MKKIYLVLLSAMLVMASACSKDNADSQSGDQTTTVAEGMRFYGSAYSDEGAQTRGIAQRQNLWENGSEITVKFLSDPYNMATQIKNWASEWEQYANIKFKFVTSGNADVRIGFDVNGQRHITWSYIGTSCKSVTNQNQATMSFAYFNLIPAKDKRADVLRAFGQVLGLELEHRHLNFNPGWTSLIQNYWAGEVSDIPWADLKKYVFDPITTDHVKTPVYDAQSIMVWPFLARYASNTARDFNYDLSDNDKKFVSQLYRPIYPNDGWKVEECPSINSLTTPIGLGYDQISNTMVVLGRDKKLYKSTNKGVSWTSQNFDGTEPTSFWDIHDITYFPEHYNLKNNRKVEAAWFISSKSSFPLEAWASNGNSLTKWHKFMGSIKTLAVTNSMMAVAGNYGIAVTSDINEGWTYNNSLICGNLYGLYNEGILYAMCRDGIYCYVASSTDADWFKVIDFAEMGIEYSYYQFLDVAKISVCPVTRNIMITKPLPLDDHNEAYFFKHSGNLQYLKSDMKTYSPPTGEDPNRAELIVISNEYVNGHFVALGEGNIKVFDADTFELVAHIPCGDTEGFGVMKVVDNKDVYILDQYSQKLLKLTKN